MRAHRILIVNVNWLGDVLFSTAFIRNLRANFPQAYIACMVVRRCRGMLENNPHLDEIIDYPEKTFFKKIGLVFFLMRKGFDTTFLLHRSFSRALIVYCAGIRQRIGYNTKKRGFLLSRAVPLPQKPMHRADIYLNLLEQVGLKVHSRQYEFFIPEKESEVAERLLGNAGVGKGEPYVVLNPGANWLPKRWPAERFAQLADEITKRFGRKIIISGAQKDILLSEEIIRMSVSKPVSLAGKTTLSLAGALFKKAQCVVSNDSGPLHIAASVGARVIGLFGPTSPKETGPRGPQAHVIWKDIGCTVPCYDQSCRHNRCMEAITVEDVISKIEEII